MKYEKPSIFFIDIDKAVEDLLSNNGFNITSGTFGAKYAVKRDTECGLNGKLDYLTEKEVVFVNLKEEDKYGINPLKSLQWCNGDGMTLASSDSGDTFNPRYLYAFKFKEEFEKILNNGGILVVFADKVVSENYNFINVSSRYKSRADSKSISNYDWIPHNHLKPINCIPGKELYYNEKVNIPVSKIFVGCEESVSYKCKFNIQDGYYFDTGVTLCSNKIYENVGYIKEYGKDDNQGYLIILPQVSDLHRIIKNLLTDILPILKPDLFPDFVKNSWINDDEYIMPDVKKIINEKEELIEKYEKKQKDLEKRIEEKKEEYSFLTNLLTSNAYDDVLVNNVKKTLEYIGYKNVIDVDNEIIGNRQEDLRIQDGELFTIVEVKGHNGNPTEDDCQAVLKYISRNMKQYNKLDIHGILVVNHHKLQPPFERPNPAFTKAQIEDAVRDEYTLVSTWELYKAVRLFQEKLILFEDINIGLHTPGLFAAIPKSWNYVGKIERLLKDKTVVCVYLKAPSIKLGDELIVQTGNEYLRVNVEEMMIDNINVDSAKLDDKLSINLKVPIKKQSVIFVKPKI